MKTRIPIRILCFVGSDIKLLRIFNALTNYFHTKSCFRESLFCFRNAVFLLLKSDSTSKETHSLLIDAPPMTSKILVDFLVIDITDQSDFGESTSTYIRCFFLKFWITLLYYNIVIITMSATNGSWCFKSAEYMYNKFLL